MLQAQQLDRRSGSPGRTAGRRRRARRGVGVRRLHRRLDRLSAHARATVAAADRRTDRPFTAAARSAHPAGRWPPASRASWASPSIWTGSGGSEVTRTRRAWKRSDRALRCGGGPAASTASAAPRSPPGIPVPRTTMTSSRPSVGSIGWRGPTRPGISWPQFAMRTTRPSTSWTSPSTSIRNETGRSRAASLHRRDDVGEEPEAPLQVGRGGGHDPGIEPETAGDHERHLAGRLAGPGGRRVAPGRPAQVDPVARCRSRSGGSRCAVCRGMPRADANTLPVPAGTIASGTPLPARAAAASRIVPSPPATATRGASGRRGERGADRLRRRIHEDRRPARPRLHRAEHRVGHPGSAGRVGQLRRVRVDDHQRRPGPASISGECAARRRALYGAPHAEPRGGRGWRAGRGLGPDRRGPAM